MLFKGEVYSWIALVVTNKGKDGQVLATNGFSKGPGLISNNKFEIKKAQEFINGTNFSTIGKKVKE